MRLQDFAKFQTLCEDIIFYCKEMLYHAHSVAKYVKSREYSITIKEAACLMITQQKIRKPGPLIYHPLIHITEESAYPSSPNNIISPFSMKHIRES